MISQSVLEVLALDVDGVLTDGRVELGPGGEESKGIAFRDLDALTAARRAGLRIALVTGEEGPLVDVIAQRTGAERVIRGAKDKAAALRQLARDMHAELDTGTYPTGVKISDQQMKALEDDGTLTRHDWHGEWNYTITPPAA